MHNYDGCTQRIWKPNDILRDSTKVRSRVSHNTASSLTDGEHVPPPSVSNMENASLRSATSSSLSPCAAGGSMVALFESNGGVGWVVML